VALSSTIVAASVVMPALKPRTMLLAPMAFQVPPDSVPED
jgi:hypothetical protein